MKTAIICSALAIGLLLVIARLQSKQSSHWLK
jgi:hypothetical protein